MQPTKPQIASRANEGLSGGPDTEAGKRRSAERILLKGESQADFATLYDQYVKKFYPADEVELGWVEQMIGTTWRLRRLIAIETTLRNDPESHELSTGSTLAFIDSNKSRLRRNLQSSKRNLALLRQFQSIEEPCEDEPTVPRDSESPAAAPIAASTFPPCDPSAALRSDHRKPRDPLSPPTSN